MKKAILALTLTCLLAFTGIAGAAMMGGNTVVAGSMMSGTGVTGTMMGIGMGMTNTGGFGMMNGMAGAPVVGNDGTAYLISYNPTASPGTVPSSNSFQSTITSVTAAGGMNSITLKGIVSRPVIEGNLLVASSSLPDMMNFYVVGNLGTTTPAGQSMVYVINLPFSPSSVPVGVSLDGQFASMPVIANNAVYVTTSDFGNGMMTGSTTFSMMYGNYNFNGTGAAHSYLYIIGFDGRLINKIQLQ